ncbi:hypothetical protein LCGC14_1600070 [marine sediment metagenome]|uniref:Uncharacterized protein n=1 Tax=marine sediment metagenome TaxID=412755 RepID=A0A0F9LBH4_9ZZZZ|nr:hypothetical protein [Marinobacter antarcticus]
MNSASLAAENDDLSRLSEKWVATAQGFFRYVPVAESEEGIWVLQR